MCGGGGACGKDRWNAEPGVAIPDRLVDPTAPPVGWAQPGLPVALQRLSPRMCHSTFKGGLTRARRRRL